MGPGAPVTDVIGLLQRRDCAFFGCDPARLRIQLVANATDGRGQPIEAIETGWVVAPLQHEIADSGDLECQATILPRICPLCGLGPANLVEHLLRDRQCLSDSCTKRQPLYLPVRGGKPRYRQPDRKPGRVNRTVQTAAGQNDCCGLVSEQWAGAPDDSTVDRHDRPVRTALAPEE